MKARIPIRNVGQYGIIVDSPADTLPLNAWSDGRNVRMKDGVVEKFLGHDGFAGTTPIQPYHLIPTKQASAFYWLYMGLTKVYVYDGSSHYNLTRQTASIDVDYTGSADDQWTGGVLGGIPILNNGVDTPQMWNPVDTGQRLQALSNWPSTYLCSTMRPFRQFLVAGNINKAGTIFPTMVKWSHPAAAGTVPASWDETDTTKDAGEYELKETDGPIVDMCPLRDANIIYKTDAIWGMQFIGGTNIFRFYPITRGTGIISKNSVLEVSPGQHAVFGMDDIFVHNGQTLQGLLDDRMRRFVFSEMDDTNYRRSFIGHNPNFSEVLFCFPERGTDLCTLAVVWNYKNNALGIRELQNIAHMSFGEVEEPNDDDIWDSDEEEWDLDEEVWDAGLFAAMRTRVAMAGTLGNSLDVMDFTNQFSSANMTAYIERKGIGFPVKADGPPDYTNRKFVTRIWPRLEGTAGGVVNVYVGTHDNVDDDPTYGTAKTFIIGTSEFIDCQVSGRLHALKFESTTDVHWRLHGYDAEVRPAGRIT